ncbi:hypothetical protein [Bradyrhizobium sp. RD5-C2]|uniref:hypothetical protein n=1 Tax=Bradyrhizobium sp. RD5-C2 TaxID=244562 RepID=UPI001CC51A62|nr:hypothetical protein [Bradyrhizobium sp. RD5-C2]GIQ74104.1 hypothetical protein BraRD5C2_25420 [Bradyrhizobium sp. RD5-C2]
MESYQKLFEEIRSLWANGKISSIQILRGDQTKGAAENIGSVNAELSRRSRELTPSGYEALTSITGEGMGSS